MRLPKRKSPKKNNMSQLFFSKAGFDIFLKAFFNYIVWKHALETMPIGNKKKVHRKHFNDIGNKICASETVTCHRKHFSNDRSETLNCVSNRIPLFPNYDIWLESQFNVSNILILLPIDLYVYILPLLCSIQYI